MKLAHLGSFYIVTGRCHIFSDLVLSYVQLYRAYKYMRFIICYFPEASDPLAKPVPPTEAVYSQQVGAIAIATLTVVVTCLLLTDVLHVCRRIVRTRVDTKTRPLPVPETL